MLKGKKIVLGVCGSIAAYKSAFLVRLLIKSGAEVKVILTQEATKFITPLTLATLSKNSVFTHFSDSEGNWHNHVELGLWADLIIIAPASANTIAKLANGLCDNLLSATYLSARCEIMIAPAMDLDMWQHPSTQNNIKKLKNFGNHIISVESGELASGLQGEGRMAEPENILQQARHFFENQNLIKDLFAVFRNKNVLISAGPTIEPIDPVRFISNHSTGKMGFSIAQVFLNSGAKVTLVKGPTAISPESHSNLTIKEVKTASEMHEAMMQYYPKSDIIIMSAAVADYTPQNVARQKIKKKADDMQIELTKTVDILKNLGEIKKENQLLIGFALETHDEIRHAQSKLKHKNLDLIVINSLNDKGAGFASDTNKVTLLDKDNNMQVFELKSKEAVAIDILNKISEMVLQHKSTNV